MIGSYSSRWATIKLRYQVGLSNRPMLAMPCSGESQTLLTPSRATITPLVSYQPACAHLRGSLGSQRLGPRAFQDLRSAVYGNAINLASFPNCPGWYST